VKSTKSSTSSKTSAKSSTSTSNSISSSNPSQVRAGVKSAGKVGTLNKALSTLKEGVDEDLEPVTDRGSKSVQGTPEKKASSKDGSRAGSRSPSRVGSRSPSKAGSSGSRPVTPKKEVGKPASPAPSSAGMSKASGSKVGVKK